MTRPLVAVTGATGFIGRRLTMALIEAGYDVRALVRKTQPAITPAAGTISWVIGDLSRPEALAALVKDATAVVHVAGAIRALGNEDFMRVNGAGTEAVAAAAAALPKPPRFIQLSSLAAREPRLSAYAASKRAGERLLKPFRDAMPVAVLRPPVVYGPGDLETLRIFRMAKRGFLLAPSPRGARASLVHVDDVIGAVRAMLAADKLPHEPVEFDDGAPNGYGWDDIAVAAGAAVQQNVRVFRIPAPVLHTFGALGSLAAQMTRRPSLLSWGKIPEILHPDWVAGKGHAISGYNPLWNIDKGFKNAADWYTSQGLL